MTSMKSVKKSDKFSSKDVKHVAKLAKLKLTSTEEKKLSPQLARILDYVSQLTKVPTENVKPTGQVTGLTNVYREDEIDASRMLSQKEALKNAPNTYNGFVKVKAVLEE